jgi:hypothetical protein
MQVLNCSTYFRRHYANCFNSRTSTEKLPPHHFHLVHRVVKTANISGNTLVSLRPVLRTWRCYKRVGLKKKRHKSFQGLAIYGHEVLMSLQTQANFIGTHFLHSYVSNIGLSGKWQFILWKKRLQHLQAIILMSDFDNVKFPVTVAKYISPFGSHLNSIGVI